MGIPTAKFFEGQKPPNLPLLSQDNLDWYREQKQRCFDGFSFRGERFTGDQWFYYNFFPMLVAKKDSAGNPTKEFDMLFPYWSQTDDYLFKQIEEADQEGLGVMLGTGRSYGKTYAILSIGAKIFYFVKKSHGVISASGKDHANETWKKFRDSITAINQVHPTIALDLIADNEEIIDSGFQMATNGRWETVSRSRMEKIIYDKKPGKSKGRRLNWQLFEEAFDWAGAATLKECIAASIGSWRVGSIKKCREFYIGTGGTVNSEQAKEIFHHPDAYGIYKIKDHSEKGTAIFIPAYEKYGGYWEKTGISDIEGAKKDLERQRENAKLDPDPTIYTKLIQEYPFTISEMFMKKGGNRFDQSILVKNIEILEMDPSKRRGEYGNLHWIKKDKRIVGTEWEPTNNGKIWILEQPAIDPERGMVPPRQYVGGYDGIDVGQNDTASGQGSKGSLAIKKRFWQGCGALNNIYVCHYTDRPREVDELYENSLMVMWHFNALTNIEDTKRAIVGYAKQKDKGLLRFFMKRPRLTLTNIQAEENDSNLIGTTATPKNFGYGETFLTTYIKHYGDQLFWLPALEDLRDFDMNNRGSHDITISMMMAEIGDDEVMDMPVGFNQEVKAPQEVYGYYTDANGKKRWGKVPGKNTDQFNFELTSTRHLDYLKRGGIGLYSAE